MTGDLELPEPPTQGLEAESPPNAKLGFLGLAIIIGVLGLIAYRIYPSHHREPKNPSFIDNIFANNLVLFAARGILFAAAAVLVTGMVFIVLSIYKRAKAGHYLTRFGPFETQAIEDLSVEVATWQQWWQEENVEVGNLRERLEQSDAIIGQLYSELQNASQEIARLQGSDNPS